MIKVVLVIIGTIIGAGFASGQEIYLFFNIYGIYGIYGIVISSILLGVIIYKVLNIVYKSNIRTYDDLIERINPIKKNRQVKNIINIFLLISFYIMVAGFSAYLSQELLIPNIIGAIIIAVLAYVTFIGDIDRLIKVNTMLIPILILFILILTIKNINFNLHIVINNESLIESIYNSIIYASYNSIILIPILVSLKKYITNKKEILKISTICSIILAILAICIYILLLRIDIDVSKIELPTVYVASLTGRIYKYIYGLIILVSIFTSAISAGYGILENYIANKKTYKIIAILICISSIFISRIGFSKLVNLLYPIFGVLGIAQIILLFKYKNIT